MIEVLPDSQSNRLGIRLSGKVNAEDRTRTYVPKVDEILASYESIRLLIQLDEDFAGGEPGGFDGAYLGKRIDQFEKVAVVGNPQRLIPLRTAAPKMKGELRMFDRDQAQEAWRWLEQ